MKFKLNKAMGLVLVLLLLFTKQIFSQRVAYSINLSGGTVFFSDPGNSFKAAVDIKLNDDFAVRLSENFVTLNYIIGDLITLSFHNSSVGISFNPMNSKFLNPYFGISGGIMIKKESHLIYLGNDGKGNHEALWKEAKIIKPFYSLWLQNRNYINSNFYISQYAGIDFYTDEFLTSTGLSLQIGLGLTINRNKENK